MAGMDAITKRIAKHTVRDRTKKAYTGDKVDIPPPSPETRTRSGTVVDRDGRVWLFCDGAGWIPLGLD